MANFRATGLLMAIAFMTLSCVAQEKSTADDQTIRVNVRMVQLDVQVLQKKTGRPVGGLTKDDFQVLEDGVPQTIAQISRDQLPLSVVLLFDLTDSVQPVLKPLGAGALAALQHLKPQDEVAVMVYSASAHLLQGFTTDHQQVVAAIDKASAMTSDMAAYFNEAIYDASKQLSNARNPESRRVIIWLTDNVPNIPSDLQHSEQQAIQEALQTGTVVSALVERSGISDFMSVAYSRNPALIGARNHHPPGDVHTYADQTGGEVMKSNKKDVSAKLAELIDQIRTRYTLGYYPSTRAAAGKFCQLKVQIEPGTSKKLGPLIVRTKAGYYR